ncbi:hypothetical protein [Roseomonas harenae]|nr:hypothetical protein [Roseomonas harenae]
MASKRHKPEEVVKELRQVGVPIPQGQAVADLTLGNQILAEAARGSF